MHVIVVEEHGYESSLRFLAYSYKVKHKDMKRVALKLKDKPISGENKFLRQIVMWVQISAPRYWWAEYATYKVGTVEQSESTMHTIKKELLTQSNFEYPIPEGYLDYLNSLIVTDAPIEIIKNALPEGFLQTRGCTLNYDNLRNMILGRMRHRLPQWHVLIREIYRQARHPDLLPSLELMPERVQQEIDAAIAATAAIQPHPEFIEEQELCLSETPQTSR